MPDPSEPESVVDFQEVAEDAAATLPVEVVGVGHRPTAFTNAWSRILRDFYRLPFSS